MEVNLFKNKIYQRINGADRGDCMKCCLATLFNKKYEEVNNFIEYEDWSKELNSFLKDNGYYIEEYLYNDKYWDDYVGLECKYFNNIITKDYLKSSSGVMIGDHKIMLGSVISPSLYDINKKLINQTLHMVLCDENGDIVFDPNPNSEYNNYPFEDEIGYNGLIEIWTLNRIKS